MKEKDKGRVVREREREIEREREGWCVEESETKYIKKD
jgi:hypothetical protein